jgi:hypothetical protein
LGVSPLSKKRHASDRMEWHRCDSAPTLLADYIDHAIILLQIVQY